MRASLFSSSLMLALLGCNGGGGSTDSDADTDVNAAAVAPPRTGQHRTLRPVKTTRAVAVPSQ